MTHTEITINQIAQNKLDFEIGCQTMLNDQSFDFTLIFTQIRNFIFNSIRDKSGYNSEIYQNAINTIPLKPTYTSVVILKTFSTRIAFEKLEKLPKSELHKTIIALLWIFKEVDTFRRDVECKNECNHEWHNLK